MYHVDGWLLHFTDFLISNIFIMFKDKYDILSIIFFLDNKMVQDSLSKMKLIVPFILLVISKSCK